MRRAVAAMVGLSGFLAVACKGKNDDPAPTAAAALPTIGVVPDQVDGLQVRWADMPEAVLQKRNGSWFLTAPPPERPANPKVVGDILSNLAQVKVVERCDGDITVEFMKDREIAPYVGLHVVATSGSNVLTDVTFGRAGLMGQYALTKTGVWYVSGYSSWMYTKVPDDFATTDTDAAAASGADDKCSRWCVQAGVGVGIHCVETKKRCKEFEQLYSVSPGVLRPCYCKDN